MRYLSAFFLLILSVVNPGHAQQPGPQTSGPSGKPGKFTIGETWGGGKIFWLDESGQHGLVAAPSDQSPAGTPWNPGKSITTAASSDGLYAGQPNTAAIMAAQGAAQHYAARICNDLVITAGNAAYSDWYLPSRYELNLLFRQRSAVGGFNTTSGIYWSSTESASEPASMAWEQEFKLGGQYEDDKDQPNQVRCIRKF